MEGGVVKLRDKYVCQQGRVLRIIIFDIISKMDNQTGQPDREPGEPQKHSPPPINENNSTLPKQQCNQHAHDANEHKQQIGEQKLEVQVAKPQQEKVQTTVVSQYKQQLEHEDKIQLKNGTLNSEDPSGLHHLDSQKKEIAHESAAQEDRMQVLMEQYESRQIRGSFDQKSELISIQDSKCDQQPAVAEQFKSSIAIVNRKLICKTFVENQEQARTDREFEQLNQQLNKLRLQDTRKTNIIVQMETQTRRLGQQLSIYKAQYQQEKKDNINQKQLRLQFQQNIKQYQVLMDSQRKQQDKKLSEIHHYQAKCGQLEKNLAEKATKLQQINAELALIKNKHQQCEKQLSLKNSQLQILTHEKQHNEKFILVLQYNEQKLKQANVSQTEKLKDITAKYQHIQAELNNLRVEYHKQILNGKQKIAELVQARRKLEQQAAATQQLLQLKTSQISQLQAQLAHYQKLQAFKVKQQLQLQNLVSQLKSILQKQHEELGKQMQTRQGEMDNIMHDIKNTIQEKSDSLLQMLQQVQNSTKESYSSLYQTFKERVEQSNRQKTNLTAEKDDLSKQLAFIQRFSAETLNSCYLKIDELTQQINVDKRVYQEKYECWQLEKHNLKQTIYEFATQVSTLQVKLEDAAMREMNIVIQKEIQINWLAKKIEIDIPKMEKQQEQNRQMIRILNAQLFQARQQLLLSQVEAEGRQKSIIDKICTGYALIHNQQLQYDPIVQQNKEMLVKQLEQSYQLHAKLFESKLQQKDSIIANYVQKYSLLSTQFNSYKQQSQHKLQKLSDYNYNLYSQLSAANKLKQSKIDIENEYAYKQEILNDILYTLDPKKQKPTWRKILACFQKMDKDRSFVALTDILTAACEEFKNNQEKIVQFDQEMGSRDRRIQELEKDIVRIGQESVGLKSELEKSQLLKKKYEDLQSELIEFKTKQISYSCQIEKTSAELKSLRNQLDSLYKENAKLKLQNKRNKQLLDDKNRKVNESSEQTKLKSKEKLYQDQQQAARREAVSSKQIQMISNQLNLAKNTIARLTKQLQQQQQLTKAYRNKQMQNQVRGSDAIMQLQNQLESYKHQLQNYKYQLDISKNEVENNKYEAQINKEKFLAANKNLQTKQDIIKELNNKLKNKQEELTTTKQQLTKEIAEKQKAQAKTQEKYLMSSPLSFSSPQLAKSRANVKSPTKPEVKQNTIKLEIKEDPIKLQVRDNPIKLQIKESPIKLQIKESPIRLQIKESPKELQRKKSPIKLQIKDEIRQDKNRSIIFQDDLVVDFNPSLFKGSSILLNKTKENVLQRMIQKFTSKRLKSAELKFKMTPTKLDYSNDIKNINISSIAWIFRTKDSIFGAVTFSRQATEYQSAIMFNLTDQVVIEPATIKSSWPPIKSDSFYLTFGVQQARYIWKSKSFSIIDSRSSLKYFDPSKPLVPNLLRQQKNEVEEFEAYLLQISI